MEFENIELILGALGECLWFHEIFRLRLVHRALNRAILDNLRVKHLSLAVIYNGNLDSQVKDIVAQILRRSMTSILNIYSIASPYGDSIDDALWRRTVTTNSTSHSHEYSYMTDILMFLKASPSLQQLVLPSLLKDGHQGIFDGEEWKHCGHIEVCSLQRIVLGQCSHRYRRELAKILSTRGCSKLVHMSLGTSLWPLIMNFGGNQKCHKSPSLSTLAPINLAIFEPKVDAWINLKDISNSFKSVWRPSTESTNAVSNRLHLESVTGLQPLIACYTLQAFSRVFDKRFKHLKTSLQINIGTLHVNVTTSRDSHSVKLLLDMIIQNAPQLLGLVCFQKHLSSDSEAHYFQSACPVRVKPWDLDWRPHQLENDLSECAQELTRFVLQAYEDSAEPEVFAQWSRDWTSAFRNSSETAPYIPRML